MPPVGRVADIKSCYVLSDAAEADLREEEAVNAAASLNVEEKTEDDLPVEPSLASLRGLHAKLYLADCGWEARLWTGSANATEAAFSANVEFLVELRGRRADIGIEILLQEGSADGQQDKRVRLRDMLVLYRPPEVEQRPDKVEKRLERLIDQVRRQLVDARMVARCTANDEQGRTFEVRVESGVLVPTSFPVGVECSMRPVSFAPDTAVRFWRSAVRLLPSNQWPLSR